MKYFLSSVVCLLFLNTNIFASEIINCSIKPKLYTYNDQDISLILTYTGTIRNTSERYIEQANISFEVENTKILNHDETFDVYAYPNVGKSFEGRYIMIDHNKLSEDMFVKELEKTNVLLNDIMDALNNEEVKCSILY